MRRISRTGERTSLRISRLRAQVLQTIDTEVAPHAARTEPPPRMLAAIQA